MKTFQKHHDRSMQAHSASKCPHVLSIAEMSAIAKMLHEHKLAIEELQKKAEDLEKELGIKRESDGPLTQEKWMSPIQEYAKIDLLFHRDHGTKAIKNM